MTAKNEAKSRSTQPILQFFAFLLALSGACGVEGREPTDRSNFNQTVQVLNRFPHDTGAYTQGLLFHNGKLFEGTGVIGESSIREVELQTGRVLRRAELSDDHFGEGICIVGNRLFQLTWQSHIALVYDLQTFQVIDTLKYDGEGWGLTWDGQALIMSDGSATLRFRDPQNFSVLRSVEVKNNGVPLKDLNELEYVDGEIYANIYRTDYIVRIDPNSGTVLSWIDLRGLLRAEEKAANTDVLNGIAWDAATKRLFVTGKRWPVLFQIAVQSTR
jgi:glutamine cyclotransferase